MNLICFRDAYGDSLCLVPEETCQFTSHEYKGFLKGNGIRQSMDGKSRWADNIMIERWFRTFKYDEAYLTEWHNIKEARQHFLQNLVQIIFRSSMIHPSYLSKQSKYSCALVIAIFSLLFVLIAQQFIAKISVPPIRRKQCIPQ